MPRENRVEKSRVHFSCQAQYLVKLGCAAFGDILGDSRSAKRCIFQYKIVFKVGQVRSPKRRVRDAIL